jgi:hypothetical protein
VVVAAGCCCPCCLNVFVVAWEYLPNLSPGASHSSHPSLGSRASSDKAHRPVLIISPPHKLPTLIYLTHPRPASATDPILRSSCSPLPIRCTLQSHLTTSASLTLDMKVAQLAALFGGTALAVQPLAAPRKSLSSRSHPSSIATQCGSYTARILFSL